MTDRLERALRSLREDESGENAHSDETLDRILASRRTTSGVWTRRARLWIPIAAVLALATSALARSGGVAAIRTFVTSHHSEVAERLSEAPAAVPSAVSSAPVGPPALADSPLPVSVESSQSGSEPGPVLLQPPGPVPTEAPRRTASGSATPASASPSVPPSAPLSSSQASPSPATPPEPPPPSETDVYARAHRLHFSSSDPAAALAAWDDYLRQYPDGRFAPEARYNRAIDLLKMKRYAEARTTLRPFADGAYGGYHRDDARDLLRSIP
jgi:hypothetical protein